MTDTFLLSINSEICSKLDKGKFQELFGDNSEHLYSFYIQRLNGNIYGFYLNLPVLESALGVNKNYQEIFAKCVADLIKAYFAENGYQITKIQPPTPPPTPPCKTSPSSRVSQQTRTK